MHECNVSDEEFISLSRFEFLLLKFIFSQAAAAVAAPSPLFKPSVWETDKRFPHRMTMCNQSPCGVFYLLLWRRRESEELARVPFTWVSIWRPKDLIIIFFFKHCLYCICLGNYFKSTDRPIVLATTQRLAFYTENKPSVNSAITHPACKNCISSVSTQVLNVFRSKASPHDRG